MTAATPDQIASTRQAFGSVAGHYDGAAGNNASIQMMRRRLQQAVIASVVPEARLLDLGCGTGIDAVALAQQGYAVHAIDVAPEMIDRTAERATLAGVELRVTTQCLGVDDLARLGQRSFDGIYSDLGPINCAGNLRLVARVCAGLLPAGAPLVASVMGRLCPWEIGAYFLRGHPRRAFIRFRRDAVPVGLHSGIVWTRYYTPREFTSAFAPWFSLERYEALHAMLPPPYMVPDPKPDGWLARLDQRVSAWPVLRDMGDHFLLVLRRRA